MKAAAAVILYHFDEKEIRNIQTYYPFVDKLYVFDNTETASPLSAAFTAMPKLEYYHDAENKGIARRLNAAATLARKDGFEWLLTMDQDSSFDEEALVNYLQCVENYPAKEKVAMFGILYERHRVSLPVQVAKPVDTASLITSGALINLALFEPIGGFDEALFIDHVDHEYCLRARTKGYSTILLENICLNHEMGKEVFRSSIKTLFLVKKKKRLHSPLRCYYMYRNLLYLEEKYKKIDPAFLKFVRRNVFTHVMRFIYYGRNTPKTIQYMLAAARDFRQKRMGRIAKEL